MLMIIRSCLRSSFSYSTPFYCAQQVLLAPCYNVFHFVTHECHDPRHEIQAFFVVSSPSSAVSYRDKKEKRDEKFLEVKETN